MQIRFQEHLWNLMIQIIHMHPTTVRLSCIITKAENGSWQTIGPTQISQKQNQSMMLR